MLNYQEIKQRFLNERGMSILIFSFFFGWQLAFPFEGQVFYSLVDLYAINVHNLLFSAIFATFLGLFTCGFFIKNIKEAKSMIMVSTGFCIAGSIVFFFPCSFLWYLSLPLISFLAGFVVASWGFYFKSCTPKNERIKTAADVLIYSNILMILANVIAVNLSAHAGLALVVIFLVIVLVVAPKLPAEVDLKDKASPSSLLNERSFLKPFLFLYLFITIITINSGLMYQVINPAFAHHQFLVSWYWAVPYIVALYIVRNLSPQTSRAYILYVAIAMIGLTFIFFMILDRSVLSYLIVDTLMLGACGVCDLFWWSIIGEMLDYTNNQAKLLGMGLSANVLGVLIGGVIGKAIYNVDNKFFDPSVLALFVVFIILIILPLLNSQLMMALKEHAFLGKLYEIADSGKNAIDNLVKNFGLTGRESEIVGLLSKGRTYKMIASELFLSENTVKTHIKNIYSKLNVKSKAELVKMLIEKNNTISKN